MDWKSHRIDALLEQALIEDQAVSDATTTVTIDAKVAPRKIDAPGYDKIYPLDRVEEALMRVDNAEQFGKVVLSVGN